MQQASIFEYMYPEFHFSKPIRMIELFAGYGSQMLAMEYLHADCESFRLQGVKDSDSDRIREHFAKSTNYHLAGDAIPTPFLMGIFKALGANDGASALLKVSDIIKEGKTK